MFRLKDWGDSQAGGKNWHPGSLHSQTTDSRGRQGLQRVVKEERLGTKEEGRGATGTVNRLPDSALGWPPHGSVQTGGAGPAPDNVVEKELDSLPHLSPVGHSQKGWSTH